MKLLRFTHDVDELPPIVALSADATPQTREACSAVGFSAYLTKPVDTQLLLRTLAELTAGAARPAESVQPRLATPMRPEPEPAEATAGPPVDPARLASLAELDNGDGFLRSLIDDFLVDLDLIVEQLEQAALISDVRRFRDQAHALRSSAAHIGALGLFDLCLSWRELDDHALTMRVGAELAKLKVEVERVRRALQAFREEWQLRGARSTMR